MIWYYVSQPTQVQSGQLKTAWHRSGKHQYQTRTIALETPFAALTWTRTIWNRTWVSEVAVLWVTLTWDTPALVGIFVAMWAIGAGDWVGDCVVLGVGKPWDRLRVSLNPSFVTQQSMMTAFSTVTFLGTSTEIMSFGVKHLKQRSWDFSTYLRWNLCKVITLVHSMTSSRVHDSGTNDNKDNTAVVACQWPPLIPLPDCEIPVW